MNKIQKLTTEFPFEFFLQVRFYPRTCNLDNAFSLNVKLPAPAFLVNVFRCLLLVYCSDCRVVFFSLERTDDDPSKKAVKVLLFVRLKPFYVFFLLEMSGLPSNMYHGG